MRRLWLPVFVASALLTYGVLFYRRDCLRRPQRPYYQTVQIADRHRLSCSMQDVADMTRAHDWGRNTRVGVNRDQVGYPQVQGVGQPLMALPLYVVARSFKAAARLTQPSDVTLWCLNWLAFAVLGVLLIVGACQVIGLPAPHGRRASFLPQRLLLPSGCTPASPYNVVGEMLIILIAAAGLSDTQVLHVGWRS
jgi:hypothetical protein